MAGVSPATTTTLPATPNWTRTTTLAVSESMKDPEAQPPPTPFVAPENPSGAAPLLDTSTAVGAPALEASSDFPPSPPLHSPDGRVVLTDTSLSVRGHSFWLLELERAELTPVRWLLWYLLGALGLAAVMITYLQNQLRTGPAMAGMAITALLLAYGRRGTNRLRLHRLGREMVNFALPGDTVLWQRFMAEVNRRIFRIHDQAAREAAALLAAADEATRMAALAAQANDNSTGANLTNE